MTRITTSRDLADFHENRSRLYEALATSLAGVPTPLGLATLRARLAGVRSNRPGQLAARAVLDGTPDESIILEFSRLFQGQRTVSLRCTKPSEAGIAESCLADLTALAKLAHATADAVSAGQMMRAVHQTELQQSLLDKHAYACLQSLAQALADRADCPFYRSVGVLLQELLEDDLAVLTLSVP